MCVQFMTDVCVQFICLLYMYYVVCSLQNMKSEFWGDLVTVVSGDMRQWTAPEFADIIVSELLGSFGDNELSPECLDGAQRFLKGNSQDNVTKIASRVPANLKNVEKSGICQWSGKSH